MSRRLAGLVALLVSTVLAPVGSSAAEPVVLRLAHVGFPGSLFDVTATEFARRVNAELTGKVEVRVFHSSQMGSDEQMVKTIRQGEPEMFIPASVMSTVDPKFGVFEMPYLVASRAHMRRVAEHRGVQDLLFGALPQKGMRVVGVWELGFRQITNNVRPIVKPADLNGVKLRVPSGVWRVRMFQAYGATPTAMPLNQVYDALEDGRMDGQENPLAQIHPARFHEVQKYLSLSGHVYTPAYLVVSEDVWGRLPSSVRASLSRIAREIGDFARAEGERLDRELLAKMSATMKVNEVDRAAFVKASAEIYEAFGTDVPGGSALVKTIQRLR